jgi:hypothetical protein
VAWIDIRRRVQGARFKVQGQMNVIEAQGARHKMQGQMNIIKVQGSKEFEI